MRRIAFISFVLLFGACDDTTVGGIRQVDNHPDLTLVTTADGDISTADSVDTAPSEPDTEVTLDTEIVPDTTIPDTSTADSVDVTDTLDTADTGQEIEVDTTPEADTAPEVEVVLDPCEEVVCDDHNLCTSDLCVEGECGYTRVLMDDGDSCTTDTCDILTGVVSHEPLACDDDDTATVDTCEQGECVNTLDDHDFDGYAACRGPVDGTCDCDDVGTSGGAPASLCQDDLGYYLVIDFTVGLDYDLDRPDCSYYDEEGNLIPGTLIAETDGSFLNGPQVSGHDTPDDGFDNDCDGDVDEGEPGLNICDWYESGVDGIWFVECPFMEDF